METMPGFDSSGIRQNSLRYMSKGILANPTTPT